MEIVFTPGQFVSLRATTTFHLGAIETDITKGDVVEYDGTTLKLGDARHHIAAIFGAVKAGWLVPLSDTTTTYRPRSSHVNVRPATTASRDRGDVIDVRTVHEEDRDLGTLKTVRDRGDGIVRKRMSVLAEDASSEGVAVGKVNRPTHAKATLTPENAMRIAQEVHRIDDPKGTSGRIVTPLTTEARVIQGGDDVADLLGGDEVVVAKLPPVRTGASLGEGDRPHLTDSEKEERDEEAASRVEAARRARRMAAEASAAKVGVELAPAKTAEPSSGEAEDVFPADLAQKVQFVRAVIPNFEWDMSRHWRARVADAVKRYGKNPLYLNGILSVETETVKAHVVNGLSKA